MDMINGAGNAPPSTDLSQQQQQQQQPPPPQASTQPIPPQQIPVSQHESHTQQSQSVPPVSSQQNSANVTPQQQPTMASLTAAANVIVEGITSVVNESVNNANEDGER